MIILSHRGYWKTDTEKNTKAAFIRSFDLGLGAELDVRDYCGRLVVSHDVPDSSSLNFEHLLEIYCNSGEGVLLAFNIKSDGLQDLILSILNEYSIENYFVFDMSVPDALGYMNVGLNTFTRESEYETQPAYYERADGIWMDEINNQWITEHRILQHSNNGKKVCIVSPELHNRNHLEKWRDYKAMNEIVDMSAIILCTDFPEEARRYFND